MKNKEEQKDEIKKDGKEAEEFTKFFEYLNMFFTNENYETFVIHKTKDSTNVYVFTKDGEKSNDIINLCNT